MPNAQQRIEGRRGLGPAGVMLQVGERAPAGQRRAPAHQPAHVDDLRPHQRPGDTQPLRAGHCRVLRAPRLQAGLMQRGGKADRITGGAAPDHGRALCQQLRHCGAGDGRPAVDVHRRDQLDRPLEARLALSLDGQHAVVDSHQGRA
jgi:hypothetical protein